MDRPQASGTFSRLQRALTAFQRVTHPAASLQLLVGFLEVAREEGRTQVEMMRALGQAESTMSRQLIDLGPFNRHKQPGFSLVEGKMDPMDMRVKRYALTPRGRALAAIMAALLDGKMPTEVEAELRVLEVEG